MNEHKTKHTPGPWQVAQNKFSVYASDPHFVVANTLMPLNRAVMPAGSQEAVDAVRDTQRVNAKLIAASPLMLEVLQEIEWFYNPKFEDFCTYCGRDKSKGHYDTCKLDAAIKAATDE